MDTGQRPTPGSAVAVDRGAAAMVAGGSTGTKSTEAWTALVGVADARSEYVKTRGILNHIATRSALDVRETGSRGCGPAWMPAQT